MTVFVLGMHRSGTSAVAGLVSQLGLRLSRADDLAAPMPDNPEGFWESRALSAVNDDLLRVLGGTWSAPPQLAAGWLWDPRLEERRAAARMVFDSVYQPTDDRDWLWKDPRNSLLLPFWASLLNVRPIVILASRHPLEVWRSLQTRNGLAKALALALWERYVRAALLHARGLQVFVVPYARLLEDRERWTEDLRCFLERCGVRGLTQPGDARPWERLKPELRHMRVAFEDLSDAEVSHAQRETYRTLEDLAGPHDCFEPPALEAESSFTEPLLAERRRGDLFEAARHEIRGTEIERARTQIDCLERELAGDRATAGSYISSLERALAEEREQARAQRETAVVELRTAQERAATLSRHKGAEMAAARSETAALRARVLALRAEVERLRICQRDADDAAAADTATALRDGELKLRHRESEFRKMIDEWNLRAILGPWAARRWQLVGSRVPQRLRGAHEWIGLAAGRRYRGLGWERNFQHSVLQLLSQPAAPDPPAPDPLPAPESAALRLPGERAAAVSIVIPVHGRVDLTEECLRSVRATTDDRDVEVIVVDNASTDGSAAFLEGASGEMGNLLVLRNETNVGFGPACNQGAAVAAGEIIAFLNNDTRVLPGWLEALASRLRGHERIGAVGARLIYPDARLQEAGAIIWQDGSGWNFGRGDVPSLPGYERAREVDYCSAACLVVRSDLFRRLGGFDDAFAPAYYEDTDLCFRIRNAGYAVVYEPGAVVVHEEGGTAGTDDRSGYKAAQMTRNRELFVNRWKRVLEHQWPANAELVPLAAHRRPSMLVVVPHVPMEDFAAGDLRLQRILDGLAKRFSITMLASEFHVGYDGSDASDRHLAWHSSRGIEVIFRRDRSLEEELRRRSYEFVWLEFYDSAREYVDVVQGVSPGSTVIVDSVDVHFARRNRGAELFGDVESSADREILKRTELAAYVRSDLVLAATEDDRRILQAELPNVLTDVVPTIHVVSRNGGPPDRERDRVLFIGGFRHPPNVDAVLYFAAEIWPQVRQRRPDLRFSILGSMVPPEVLALESEGIEVVGRVADTTPYYDRALVSVAPLRYGAGMKGKIGEAFALGVPVVTTRVGAEGMGLEDGIHARLADDAGEFARAVIELCEDRALAERLSRNAKQIVGERWSPEVVNQRLLLALARSWVRHNLGREQLQPS